MRCTTRLDLDADTGLLDQNPNAILDISAYGAGSGFAIRGPPRCSSFDLAPRARLETMRSATSLVAFQALEELEPRTTRFLVGFVDGIEQLLLQV